ncbi:MAG: hypothetical protein AAB875_01785 [Patescibacteria group bacterium]
MKTLSQITNPALGPTLTGQSGIGFFQSLIPRLVGISFVVGSLVFFFVMVIGAIQWITSGGDKAANETARGKISNAIIGFVILLAVFAVLKVIEDFFGFNILTLDIGPLKVK